MNEILSRLDAHACVLDLGCGRGSFAHDHCAARVIAIDRQLAGQPRSAGSRVDYLVGDAGQVPLPAGSVDVVVCNHIFEHVRTPQLVAAEISRVLKPGGILFATVPDGYSFSDGLFRRLGGHREHIQRYTFRSFQQTLESGTDLQLLHTHRLYSSFSFLSNGSPGGLRGTAIQSLMLATRIGDAVLNTSSSLYGWACYFGKPEAQLRELNREEFLNVCGRCGRGCSAEDIWNSGRVRRSFGVPTYRCDCGFSNPYFGGRMHHRILGRASQPVEADNPDVAWATELDSAEAESHDPNIDRAGISNLYPQAGGLSPGSLVVIAGRNLAAGEESFSGNETQWPFVLGGTQLLVNGRVMPLFSVSPQRIVALLPADLARGPARFEVRRGDQISPPRFARLALTAPCLLADGGNPERAAVTRDVRVATLRATGLGPIAPPLSGGQLCPPGFAFLPTRHVTVWVGGQPAPVEHCALQPGEVGIFEIKIPLSRAPSGETVYVEAGGRRSNVLRL